ncbi:hypothetical protein SA22_4294 [Salmonella enterica subsp. enterica serovar Agona str. 22.H.04]|uniref:Uncharacterized protein n=5 Tax=Salmonella enterica I TaxID=59201 RepID=A0A0N1QZH8_SALSV|nr:hypothetical protein SeSA_A0335 [Salmonella enterica subsp. enterica serovar Schwarzengrund str. CVM19633]ACH51294.1 hypothetical protein SeAg_B0328 [Salmonella enterica subsp. enterica serovar Agona str. SL483]AIE04235.1 hypothetical protein DC51_0317 [Salmonella enterica subsp. enterica serovar Typhimurium]AKD06973.1 hypothetical protein AX05_10420 [Salmonella enterica subsp. enterica serovar Typhimurium str. CDC 2011K-0870]EDX45329.1 hypothetical protein SeKA_A4623 [Salmonella enterica su
MVWRYVFWMCWIILIWFKKGGYSNEKHKKIDYRKCVEHDGC